MSKIFLKNLMHFAQLSSQKSTKSGIFHFFRKSGSGRCSKCSKTCENLRKFKIQKKFEKLILELSFGGGFIRIYQLARFKQNYEICRFSDFPDFRSKSYINLLRIYIGFEPKSEKSENRFYVWSCNFWSRIAMDISNLTFSRPGTIE